MPQFFEVKKPTKSCDYLYATVTNDECYTPEYAVTPLLQFLPKDKIYWCPFDKETSAFVQVLHKNGYEVTHSHIDNKQDFYFYEPDKWDIAVSNPPFTNKKQIFARLLSFNKPFAMIMSLTWLNDKAPVQLFKTRDLQLLMFDQRIKYVSNSRRFTGNPAFASAYFCCDLLPKQIIMTELTPQASFI